MADEEENPTRLTKSFSARMRRKEKVTRGEVVPDMPEDSLVSDAGAKSEETDEEAALSDEELLAKYGVDDPEAIEDADKLDNLLQDQFPDRIRQMALRRMWRLNPLFRFADEMVEYGEDYTDAATVIEGMQTAYQVGKGYLQKAFDAVDDEADAAAMAGSEAGSLPDAKEKTPAGEEPTQLNENDASPEDVPEDAPENHPENDETPDDRRGELTADQMVADAPASHGIVGEAAFQMDGSGSSGGDAAAEPPPPRPRRMSFRRPAE